MRRFLTWTTAALGIAALIRRRRRRKLQKAPGRAGDVGLSPEPAAPDPAAELRRKLAEARDAGDDRDEFDAAEGTPVDEIAGGTVATPTPTLEERRAAIHAKAQEALGEMDGPPQA